MLGIEHKGMVDKGEERRRNEEKKKEHYNYFCLTKFLINTMNQSVKSNEYN